MYHIRGIDPLAKLGYTYSQAYRQECFDRWQSARQQAISVMLELIRRVGLSEQLIVAEYRANFKGMADTRHLNQLLDELSKYGVKTKWINPKSL